jgi:hypothetical protein
MDLDTTGDIDIRVVRQWLNNRDGFRHGAECTTKLICGFDDNGVYLICLECNEKTYVGLHTYETMKRELNV